MARPLGRSLAAPDTVWHPESPPTASAAASSAPGNARVPRIAIPPRPPPSSVTRGHGPRQTSRALCDIWGRGARFPAYG
ncbi:hypothetical protein SY2F82_08460 [Streptomyces sp. Y2F8-2]|nr:hypothetical protein SY2F82_08460 [Streptomyces sp. Y2F8-2]